MGTIKDIVRYFRLKFKYGFLNSPVCFKLTSMVSIGCTFEGANRIGGGTIFSGSMGYGSYIGHNCEMSAHIGRFTSIAGYVHNAGGIHPYAPPYATTCPMFFSTRCQNGQTFANRMMFDEIRKITEIGNDCWIGENVFFTGGIKIEDGAIVLAGAVVTKDVPPYAIVGGVPARILKYRYDNETIDFLLNLQWWNKDIEWLRRNWELLCDVEKLKKQANELLHP